MSLSDLVKIHHNFLSPDVCEGLIKEFDTMLPARWVYRDDLGIHRSMGGYSKCSYWSSPNKCLGKDLYNKLFTLAPSYKGRPLAEIVVNRYLPGDFISTHMDGAPYTYNIAIHMQTGIDGIQIENEFLPDEVGRAVILKGIGVPHSVPPVINKRYTLIYLYD